MSKDRKLDIFQALDAIDRRNGDWFASQPEAARKEFAPVVVTRWAATTENGPNADLMLWLVNERVNRDLFDLHKHPELVFRLLASCGIGRPLRHKWLAAARPLSASNKALALLAEHHPSASEQELEMLLSLYSREDFANFVADLGGEQASNAKEYMKAYDKLYPENAPKAKPRKGKT